MKGGNVNGGDVNDGDVNAGNANAGDANGDGAGTGRPRTDLEDVLEGVCRSALALIASVPGPPLRRVVLQVDQMYLEVEWPEPGRAPAEAGAPAPATAPAPVPATAPPAAAAAAVPPADGDADHQVKAPAVGTFYRRPEPSAEPFAEVGDRVEAGGQVAIVEAMKLMIPVESPVAGTVVAVHAEDGAPVEYDQPLLSIRPSP
ncbi:acetyl-CoA carboxylase biotin carboxyl carrier protein [Actinomadura viridis]|uniref:acetyl-CoA carboxylase biotin carboxyl carrier protein n=1 Tax=Actinomadura viridis TaxID=58110 RepID=UPI00367B321D